MIGAQPLPDLNALSDAEKDRLIGELWDALQRERQKRCTIGEPALERAAASNEPQNWRGLLDRLRSAKPHKTSSADVRTISPGLGKDLGSWSLRLLAAVAVVTGLALCIDLGIGWFMENQLARKREADLRLEQAAFSKLSIELVSVAYEPGQDLFRVTMALENLDPAASLYVMVSPVRVFEQSGLIWKEVPTQVTGGTRVGVVKLTDRLVYQTIFEPNLKEWTQLIPGYMHIRFENNLLISQRSEPDEDIIERKDPYYVYLKPRHADDAAIRKAMKFKGDPPVFIPMPPH